MKKSDWQMLSLGAVLMLLTCSLGVNVLFISGKLGGAKLVQNVAWKAEPAPVQYAANNVPTMIDLPPPPSFESEKQKVERIVSESNGKRRGK